MPMLFHFMRARPLSLILPLTLIGGLAACGPDNAPQNSRLDATLPNSAQSVEPSGNRVEGNVTAIDPGANESAAADRADTVPIAFQGRWTGAKDRCADAGAELELQVMPKQLVFHESVGAVTRVTRQGGGRVAIDAAFTGEGESWTRRLELRASADGRTLTVSNDGQAVVRKHCKDAA